MGLDGFNTTIDL